MFLVFRKIHVSRKDISSKTEMFGSDKLSVRQTTKHSTFQNGQCELIWGWEWMAMGTLHFAWYRSIGESPKLDFWFLPDRLGSLHKVNEAPSVSQARLLVPSLMSLPMR